MGNGKMEPDYFEEKKDLAIAGFHEAQLRIGETTGLVSSLNYDVPNIINAAGFHEEVLVIKSILDNVRRDFEKARWAATDNNLEFDAWLIKNGHQDLVT